MPRQPFGPCTTSNPDQWLGRGYAPSESPQFFIAPSSLTAPRSRPSRNLRRPQAVLLGITATIAGACAKGGVKSGDSTGTAAGDTAQNRDH